MENFSKPIGLREVGILAVGAVLFMLYPLCQNLLRQCVFYLYKIPNILKPIVLAAVLLLVFCLMPDGIPNFIYAGF